MLEGPGLMDPVLVLGLKAPFLSLLLLARAVPPVAVSVCFGFSRPGGSAARCSARARNSAPLQNPHLREGWGWTEPSVLSFLQQDPLVGLRHGSGAGLQVLVALRGNCHRWMPPRRGAAPS